MGEFTKAVFDSKEFFNDDVMKKFEMCDSRRSRLQFVNKQIPKQVTDFLRIEESNKTIDNESENEEELNEEDGAPSCSHSLMVPHHRFPNLSDCASVEYHKERGRYLTAGRKIKRGEIVAVESPVVAFPVIKECEDYCNSCYKSLIQTASADAPPAVHAPEPAHSPAHSSDPLPCEQCQVVFWCSTKCKIRAISSHHKYECKIRFPDLVKQGHPGIGKLFMIFRIFTQKSVEYFRQHKSQFLDYNPCIGSGLEDHLTSDYTTLFNLARHEPQDPAKQLEVSIVSIVFVRMLTAIGYFQSTCQQTQLSADQETVAELISVLVPVINVNTHPLHDGMSEHQNKTVSAAVYPVCAALFNHSCDPSLIRASWGDRLVLAAGRDINIGEELTDMYTVHWVEYQAGERREYLERVFHFTCKCVACSEGWEPVEDDISTKLDRKTLMRLAAHNLRTQTEHRLMYLIANKLD